jgi:hypothetical protein
MIHRIDTPRHRHPQHGPSAMDELRAPRDPMPPDDEVNSLDVALVMDALARCLGECREYLPRDRKFRDIMFRGREHELILRCRTPEERAPAVDDFIPSRSSWSNK